MSLLTKVIKQYSIIKNDKMMKAVINNADLNITYRGALALLSGETLNPKKEYLKKLNAAALVYFKSDFKKYKNIKAK